MLQDYLFLMATVLFLNASVVCVLSTSPLDSENTQWLRCGMVLPKLYTMRNSSWHAAAATWACQSVSRQIVLNAIATPLWTIYKTRRKHVHSKQRIPKAWRNKKCLQLPMPAHAMTASIAFRNEYSCHGLVRAQMTPMSLPVCYDITLVQQVTAIAAQVAASSEVR